MTVLSELYASSGDDVILQTLELNSEAFDAPLFLVRDYQDHIITTEDARTVTAVSCGMDIALPKRDSRGDQNLTFAIDNVRGEASKLMRDAKRENKPVYLTYRCYLSSNLSAPAERPYYFIVRNYRAVGATVEVTAGVFDLIGTAYPRKMYDANFSPAITYL